ncbi:SIMPL domain-containing protein [Tenacibaculum soleae]|uniref:SIMPL domain-containing protein n=1 Tax=Tenacibaculum soleae TaxID=447689 RepID=UPI002301EAB3|nr:SIMPL domain-containing protein [Tenacibaculum soleae]
MKNLNWAKTSLLAMALVFAGYFIGNSHWKALKNNRKVTVKGLAKKEVNANLAVWPMVITLTNNSLGDLKTNLDNQKKAVKNFFLSKGFSDNEITIGNTNITDAQADLYGNNRQKNFRYLAKTEVTLRTSDLKKIKEAQKEVINLAAKGVIINSKNTWRPIEFIFTDLNTIKPQMIEEATKKAKEVAEKFAKDSNSSVGKIKNAQQGLFTINDRDVNTPDIKIVRVVTTVTYFLKD